MQDQITTQLNTIFQEVFEDENLVVSPELTASDVDNWTSITNVMMVNQVEEEFKIKIGLGELMRMQNVGDLMEVIASKLS
jgi:acyl carrier protein